MVRAVHDPEHVRHGPTCRFQPFPAGQALRDEVEVCDVAGDIRADHAVTDAVKRDLGAFLFHEQRLFQHLAFDGIPEGAQQPARLDLAFDQVVLSALTQRHGRGVLIVQARQHDQGNVWCDGMGTSDRLQSLGVAQPQVEQDQVERMGGQVLLRLSHVLDVRQFCVGRGLLVQHLPNQAGVSRVVFDQEQARCCHRAHPPCRFGNLTFVSQKSVVLATSLSNAANCTGLLR